MVRPTSRVLFGLCGALNGARKSPPKMALLLVPMCVACGSDAADNSSDAAVQGGLPDSGSSFAPDASRVDAGPTTVDDANVSLQNDAGGDGALADGALGDASSAGSGGPAHLTSCLATATLKPGKSSFSIKRDGTDRAVNVYVPSNYDGKKPLPLVVDFHGLGEGAALHEVVSNWDDAVDQQQFIVAMPQGIQNSWNVGPCCTESRSVDDVQFARDLVGKIAADGCIDPTRIYATGYSNGGGISMKVACDAADLFAAAAPAAFALLKENEAACKPSRPISVFIFRGDADPIVPFAGGASTPPTLGYSLPGITFLSAQATFERWGAIDECTGAAADSGGGCMTYGQCKAGVKVTFCTKNGGGHDPSDVALAWPMLKEYQLP